MNIKDILKRIDWMVVLKIAVVALALALAIQTCRIHKASVALKADQVAVNDAKKEVTKAQDKEVLAVKAKKKSDEALVAEQRNSKIVIAKANARADAEHQAKLEAQAQIKTLTGDQLATQIGARINTPGGSPEIAAVIAGGFTLTRPGGEKTYSIFLDGEQAIRDVKTKDGIITQKDKDLKASGDAKATCDNTVKAKDETIKAMGVEAGKKDTQIHDLKLARTWKFVTGLIEGTIVGGVIVWGLHLFGVIK